MLPDQTPSSRVDDAKIEDAMSQVPLPKFGLVEELSNELVSASPEPAKILDLVGELPRMEIPQDGARSGADRSQDRMKDLLAMDARVFEGQTLHEHTLRVMDQYMKYFADVGIPAGLSRGDVLLKLALHDSGKGIPPDKHQQHEATVGVTDWLFDHGQLPIAQKSYAIIRELIHGDPIGAFVRACADAAPPFAVKKELHTAKQAGQEPTFREVEEKIVDASRYRAIDSNDRIVESTAAEIDRKAEALGISAADVLTLYLRFYQSDTTAYTVDSRNRAGARGSPSLEGLYEINPEVRQDFEKPVFVYDPAIERLRFAAGLEDSIRALETKCRELDAAKGR